MVIHTDMRGPTDLFSATRGRAVGAILLVATLSVTPPPAHAASQLAKGTGTIKVVVPNDCTLSVTGKWTLPATYASGGQISQTDSTSNAGIDVQCTGDATPQLNIPLSVNASGGVRRMADGTGHFISYALMDNNNNVALGQAGQTILLNYDVSSGSAYYNGNFIDFGVRVAAQSAPPPGSYSDTLTLSVTY